MVNILLRFFPWSAPLESPGDRTWPEGGEAAMRAPALGEGAAEDVWPSCSFWPASPSTARPFVEIEDGMRMEATGALDLKGLEMW